MDNCPSGAWYSNPAYKSFFFALQGWTTDPGRDAQLEYRLSIYHARTNDTGSYTCTTPTEQSHTVDIIVKDVSNFVFFSSVFHFCTHTPHWAQLLGFFTELG